MEDELNRRVAISGIGKGADAPRSSAFRCAYELARLIHPTDVRYGFMRGLILGAIRHCVFAAWSISTFRTR